MTLETKKAHGEIGNGACSRGMAGIGAVAAVAVRHHSEDQVIIIIHMEDLLVEVHREELAAGTPRAEPEEAAATSAVHPAGIIIMIITGQIIIRISEMS